MLSKIREKAERLVWLLRNGRLPQAIGFASQIVLGHSLYMKHLATYFDSNQLPVTVEGNVMYLSPVDAGVTAELFHFGRHEPEATEVMRREFGRLKRTSEDPVVLDIGAHRGYYAFQAADLLDGSGTVYTFEPDLDNFDALRKGIEANGFDNVHAERCGIGDENTTDELHVARSSNSHTLRSVPETNDGKYTGETVETDIYRIDTYLADNGIAPEDVDLVKIDVEGYEAAAFEGMEALLNADSDLSLFVELHPHRVEPAKLHSIVDSIRAAGFELIHASSSDASSLPDYEAVRQHLTVRSGRHTVGLIARRRRTAPSEEPSENGLSPESSSGTKRNGVTRTQSAGNDD